MAMHYTNLMNNDITTIAQLEADTEFQAMPKERQDRFRASVRHAVRMRTSRAKGTVVEVLVRKEGV